ncbi:MAG: sortase [Clostridia bacterium]|nr:sortase [Clostridia bacterium]
MNQILVTEKLYITPELKRKKKLYKLEFFLSIFLVCVLVSAYIYAEYDRNKSEEVSQEILSDLQIPQEDTTIAKNNVLVVVLSDEPSEPEEEEAVPQPTTSNNSSRTQSKKKTKSGYEYTTIATINIPKINLTYPIVDGTTHTAEETEALLKISPTKFWGPDPNSVGNFCVVGHNYRNSRFFSKVPTLAEGDSIDITDMSGKTITYKIYTKYQVDPTDVSCTTQLTNGRREITLITCTDDSKYRVVVKARQVK